MAPHRHVGAPRRCCLFLVAQPPTSAPSQALMHHDADRGLTTHTTS